MENNIFDGLLVEKYRPQNLTDLVLDPSVREYFDNILKTKEIPHLLFCGPAGTGKCLDGDELLEIYISDDVLEKLKKGDIRFYTYES